MMSLRKKTASMTAVLIVAVFPLGAVQGGFDGFNINSSTFDNLYNGNDIWDGASFQNLWNQAGGATTASLTTVGTTLQVLNDANNGWLEHDGGSTPWEAGTGSWTLEVSAKLTDTGAANDNFVLWTALGGQRLIINIQDDGVLYNTDGASLASGVDNTDVFHTFRIAYDSSATTFHVWRDDVALTGAGGVAPTTGTSNTRLIVGDCCTSIGNPIDQFEIDYVRYDMDGAFSPVADAGAVSLNINRDSGNISLANTSAAGISDIIGYSVTSAAGALDQTNWNQQAVGPSQLTNDNDDWTVLTAAGASGDLSEAVLITSGDGNGGDLDAGSGVIDFGDVWVKSPAEDIQVELLLNDGTSLFSGADFILNYSGTEVVVGDISGSAGVPDGAINLLDWVELRSNVATDLSAFSGAQAYQEGDLDADGVIGASDYNIFVAAFDAANGAGAFAAAVGAVPEPAGVTLLLCGLIGAACNRPQRSPNRVTTTQHERGTMKYQFAALVAVAAWCCLAVSAGAVSDFVVGNYDANAGNPVNAAAIESPEVQGWTEWASGAQGQDPSLATQEGVVGNDNTNAWLNDDQDGGTNPGYFVDVDGDVQQAMFDFGWKYESVLTMINGGHFTAFGVGANNPWGLAENARVGYAPSTDGSTITFDPVDGGGGANIVTPAGTSGDFYRVVVTGDAQATTGTVAVFDFSDGTQVGSTENYATWAGGNSLNANRLGLQSGSSGGANRTAQIHSLNLSVTAPDTLTLKVNTDTGAMTLINESGSDVSFNGYFIDSDGGALNSGGWNSLQNQNVGGGTVGQGDGWEEFDSSDANFLGEGFLTGATTLSSGQSLSLGAGFNTAVFGAGNDGDLRFTLTDAAGRSVLSDLFSTVDYVGGGGVVGGADFLAAQRGNPAVDIPNWEAAFGTSTATAAAAGVPEPGTGLMLTIAGFLVGGCSIRRTRTSAGAVGGTEMNAKMAGLAAAMIMVATAGIASAEVFNDRDYQLGDDTFGLNADSQGVDTVKFPAAANSGAFQDLTINGSPATVSAAGRPGAGGGSLATSFSGSGDALTSGQSLNSPNQTWNNLTIYPDNGDGYDPPTGVDGPDSDTVYDPAFPHNYSGIFGRGIQLWAKPDAAGLGQGNRQDLVLDTEEHGIYITEDDTWGFQFDCDTCLEDTGVAVDTVNWTHIMHLGGVSGGALDGAMLINGVAAGARAGFYDNSTAGLSIGSNLAGDGNFYDGVLDDVRIFLYGDNSEQAPAATNIEAGHLGGGDWGSLDLGTDNDWIAQQLASLGVTDRGDVDLDGNIDADDVTAFIDDWQKVQTLNNVAVGDWNSRSQNSDLNYDGTTNLQDAFILHASLQDAGLGGLNFALLGTAVPEPSSTVMFLAGLAALPLRYKR